jgi:serine/threonine kinase PknH
MGEVYEAERTVKEWTVAVKLMTAEFSKDPVFRERMQREARITARLQLRRSRRATINGDAPIDGTDLNSLLKRFGPLTPPRAVAIITSNPGVRDCRPKNRKDQTSISYTSVE